MAAKGTLKTADIVPNIATSAISFELTAAASNSKKKAIIARITSMVAIKPQFIRPFSGHEGNIGIMKQAAPMPNISARKI
jgi:hypothetical protein